MKLHAIEALGKMRSPDTVEPLLFVLFNDPDVAVRTDAVRALGDIGDARAVDFLLTALDDLDVRPVAVESLGKSVIDVRCLRSATLYGIEPTGSGPSA